MQVATKFFIRNMFWWMSQGCLLGCCCQKTMFLLLHSEEKAAVPAVAVECLGAYLGMYLLTATSLRRCNLISIPFIRITHPNTFRRGERKPVALCRYFGGASETYC